MRARELISQSLTIHVDNEFQILSYLGKDLPGALVAEPMAPDVVPESVLTTNGKAKVVRFEVIVQENKFSLAGVQMKFSMKEKDDRYNVSKGGEACFKDCRSTLVQWLYVLKLYIVKYVHIWPHNHRFLWLDRLKFIHIWPFIMIVHNVYRSKK